MWGKYNTSCIPGHGGSKSDDKETLKAWAQVTIISLAFAVFPLTLYVAGQAKVLEKDLKGLAMVAGAVLLEVIYILCMGAVTTVCMSGQQWVPVACVTGILSVLLLLCCGCCCHYPKVRECLLFSITVLIVMFL